MALDGIWPARHRTRDEQAYAVDTPGQGIQQAGSGTTMHTPMRPVERE